MSAYNTTTKLASGTSILKNMPGSVFAITVFNANAAARYLQLHNLAAALSGSEVPAFTCLVPAGAQIIIGTDFFGETGMTFAIGIVIALSTTRETYTAATASDHSYTTRWA